MPTSPDRRCQLSIFLFLFSIGISMMFVWSAWYKLETYVPPESAKTIQKTITIPTQRFANVLEILREPWTKRQLTCLADNIYYEARGEPLDGQVAVAQVTINRAESVEYPNTICNVVYQKGPDNCAFSWTCHNDQAIVNRKSKLYVRIYALAESLYMLYYRNKALPDITNGSMFYVRKGTFPRWRKDLTIKLSVGNQVFLASK